MIKIDMKTPFSQLCNDENQTFISSPSAAMCECICTSNLKLGRLVANGSSLSDKI